MLGFWQSALFSLTDFDTEPPNNYENEQLHEGSKAAPDRIIIMIRVVFFTLNIFSIKPGIRFLSTGKTVSS